MDATAPPAPTLVEPTAGARQKANGTFEWNPVTDPSGLTYVLEIFNSQSFDSASLLLRKTDLTSAQYTLTKEEKLKATKKDAPDFWRVRAIDNASNESPWSNARSFVVGSPFPTWALWTLIGLGALIIILFAYWLGRRGASKTPSTRIEG
jgi:hypothetical protein